MRKVPFFNAELAVFKCGIFLGLSKVPYLLRGGGPGGCPPCRGWRGTRAPGVRPAPRCTPRSGPAGTSRAACRTGGPAGSNPPYQAAAGQLPEST